MLISPEYVKLNEQLHEDRADYGANGHRYAQTVRDIAGKYSCETALDYGCGKATLSREVNQLSWRNYDPCVPKYAASPAPQDLIVCGDVLEHIEPECLEDVLDHLRKLTMKVCYLVIATRPAVKTLADGRNAHLIVEKMSWWLPQLCTRWEPELCVKQVGEFAFVGAPK